MTSVTNKKCKMKYCHLVESKNNKLFLLEYDRGGEASHSGHFEEISIKDSHEISCGSSWGIPMKDITDIIYFFSKKKYGVVSNKRQLVLDSVYDDLLFLDKDSIKSKLDKRLFNAELFGYKGIIDIDSYSYIVKNDQLVKLDILNSIVSDFTTLSKLVVKTYGLRGLLDNNYNELTKVCYDNINVHSHSISDTIVYQFYKKNTSSVGFQSIKNGLTIVDDCKILNESSYFVQDCILLERNKKIALFSFTGRQLLPFEYTRIDQIKGTNLYITYNNETSNHDIFKKDNSNIEKISNDNLIYCNHTDHDVYGLILCIIQNDLYVIKNVEGKVLATIESVPEGYKLYLSSLSDHTIECYRDDYSDRFFKHTEYITIDFKGNELSRRIKQIQEWGDDWPDDSEDWRNEYYGAFEDDPSAEWR